MANSSNRTRGIADLPEHLRNLDWDELIAVLADAPDDIKAIIERHLELNDERISEASNAWFAQRGYSNETTSATDDARQVKAKNEAGSESTQRSGYRNEPRYQRLAEGFVPAHARGK
jgi:hypothetical protein